MLCGMQIGVWGVYSLNMNLSQPDVHQMILEQVEMLKAERRIDRITGPI